MKTLLLAAALSASVLTSLQGAVQAPRAIAQPSPAYPFDLRKDRIEGVVALQYTVTADGRVANPVVIHSSNRFFRKLVLAAVKKWTFEPALQDGRPVSVRASQTFVFEMADKSASADLAPNR